MADDIFLDPLSADWQEEGLFARDVDGQLIRLETARNEDYYRRVHLWIDNQLVVVPAAVPSSDSQGNIINDEDGKTIPRLTTIYDAALQLFEQRVEDAFVDLELPQRLERGDIAAPGELPDSEEASSGASDKPIPILCHRAHMTPVGVCRVCSVEIGRPDSAATQIVPACWHPVRDLMMVNTKRTSERIDTYVSVLLGLLHDDHHRELGPAAAQNVPGRTSELERLCTRLNIPLVRFSRRSVDYEPDESSAVIRVNHNACILCERCIRGCNEIKRNHVIGRTGKGYAARIAFDLDEKMRDSTCVSCGECMISCPTEALTYRKPVESDWWRKAVQEEASKGNQNARVSAAQLKAQPLFKNIPYNFLEWNTGAVVRRVYDEGDVLCRAGEYGATAFVLNKGKFGIWAPLPQSQQGMTQTRRGLLGRLFGGVEQGGKRGQRPKLRVDEARDPDSVCDENDLILGEMTCISDFPRTATVKALEDGSEVYEIRRNVLYMLRRDPVARKNLHDVYVRRALSEYLPRVPLFRVLDKNERDGCVEALEAHSKLVHVDPGQIIFRQGERADVLYLIRLGYVKFWRSEAGRERVLDYFGPGKYFGEIAILSKMGLLAEEEVPRDFVSLRTANCSALDDVELVKIEGDDFEKLVRRYPKLQDKAVQFARGLLEANRQSRPTVGPPLDEFLKQGLYNARRLLVLDLDACTRCDECVKACADTHGGVTRLVREGLQFDRFLVASACRSCSDPYCLVGCPVDAIHREGAFDVTEIKIEDHCIGCGQCATNCPYGNINMTPVDGRVMNNETGQQEKAVIYKATTCDLCRSIPQIAKNPKAEVNCVYACPHNAAFRMSGEELLEEVGGTPASWKKFEELVEYWE